MSPVLEGITEIVAETFILKCLQTLTGIKFLLVSDTHSAKEQGKVLAQVHEAFADYISKNPFQEADMPIKSDLFEA